MKVLTRKKKVLTNCKAQIVSKESCNFREVYILMKNYCLQESRPAKHPFNSLVNAIYLETKLGQGAIGNTPLSVSPAKLILHFRDNPPPKYRAKRYYVVPYEVKNKSPRIILVCIRYSSKDFDYEQLQAERSEGLSKCRLVSDLRWLDCKETNPYHTSFA